MPVHSRFRAEHIPVYNLPNFSYWKRWRLTLQEALDRVEQLDDEGVIFAKRPWQLHSDAEVVMLDGDFRAPSSMDSRGLEYFLEVSLAKEVLERFEGRESAASERRALLVYYAEHDAFPLES